MGRGVVGASLGNRPHTIRNYFFMRMEEKLHESTYRTLWQPMQKRLGEDALTEFIRHYLMHFGMPVNESDVYTTLKERIDTSDKPALDHLREVTTFSTYYDVLLHAEKASIRQDRRFRWGDPPGSTLVFEIELLEATTPPS